MTDDMYWLCDRTDPRVAEALTRKCGICGATAGSDCRNVAPNSPPLNRIIHQDRAERGEVAP